MQVKWLHLIARLIVLHEGALDTEWSWFWFNAYSRIDVYIHKVVGYE